MAASQETWRVALSPWNTPRISSTMAETARKISGVAAARLSSAKLILLSRLGDMGRLRMHQRGLVRLDQVIDRRPEDAAEGARIDAHPEHDQDQRHEEADLSRAQVQHGLQIRLGQLA